jgi:hypothetical protein
MADPDAACSMYAWMQRELGLATFALEAPSDHVLGCR